MPLNAKWMACAATAAVALVSSPLRAGFVEVATFENSNPTTGGTHSVVTDPTDAGNKVLSFSGGNAIIDLPAGGQIADNTTGTVFFQLIVPGDDRDVSIGLGESDTAIAFGSILTQLLAVDGSTGSALPTKLQARNGNGAGGGSTSDVVDPLTYNQVYSFWVVASESAGTYDLYGSGPGITGQQLLADNFGLRRSSSPGVIDQVWLLEGGAGAGAVLIDNIYADNTGENLSNPVPEPAGLAGLAVVGGLLIRRRRH